MAEPSVPPMPEGCPWSGFAPPNVNWCEEELCAWVTNPADTWSNLAYIVLGILMIVETRNASDRRSELQLFGPASVAVGLFSGVYHASYTFFLQFFDFVGMFLFSFTVIAENALRLGWIQAKSKVAFFWAGVLFFSALVPLLWWLGAPFQGLVFLLILAIIYQEWSAHRNVGAAGSYRLFGLALLLMTIGALFSLSDVTRVWCDPKNHWLQGHALWHVFTAAALYALYRYHAQGLPRVRS